MGNKKIGFSFSPSEITQMDRLRIKIGATSRNETIRELVGICLNENHNYSVVWVDKENKNKEHEFITTTYKNMLHDLRKEIVRVSNSIIKCKDMEKKVELVAEVKTLKMLIGTIVDSRKEEYHLNEMLNKNEKLERDHKEKVLQMKRIELEIKDKGLDHKINMDLFDRGGE